MALAIAPPKVCHAPRSAWPPWGASSAASRRAHAGGGRRLLGDLRASCGEPNSAAITCWPAASLRREGWIAPGCCVGGIDRAAIRKGQACGFFSCWRSASRKGRQQRVNGGLALLRRQAELAGKSIQGVPALGLLHHVERLIIPVPDLRPHVVPGKPDHDIASARSHGLCIFSNAPVGRRPHSIVGVSITSWVSAVSALERASAPSAAPASGRGTSFAVVRRTLACPLPAGAPGAARRARARRGALPRRGRLRRQGRSASRRPNSSAEISVSRIW